MLKKSRLTLAVCALGATAPQAAILPIDYAATSDPSFSEFQPTSVSLFIDNVNYSVDLSNTRPRTSEKGGNQDEFVLFADLGRVAALPAGINNLAKKFD